MKSLNLTIPQSWNALSSSQALQICYTHYCNTQATKNNPKEIDNINEATFIIIAKQLLKGNGFFKTRKALRELRVKAYAPFVNFVFKSVDLHNFPEYIKLKRKKYYGPQFRLKNTTIGEFAFADALYYKWKETNLNVYLDLLCATLYRQAAQIPSQIDKRQPFHKLLAEKNQHLFPKLNIKQKVRIAYAFEGSRNYIVNLHPLVFPKPPKQPEGTKKQPQKYVPFGALISNKIQYDPSKLDIVESMNLYKFFAIYQNELQENLKKPKK